MINYYFVNAHQEIQRCSPGASEYQEESVIRIVAFDMIAIAQQRPRTRVIQPKGGGKAYAQIYTVNSKHKQKLLTLLVQRPIFEVATFGYALALYNPPKSYNSYHPEKSYGHRKLTKPDGTNILKFYEDLLEGLFMPKDQFLNPTMCERYYAPKDQLIFATAPADDLTFNLPRKLKQYFLGSHFLK